MLTGRKWVIDSHRLYSDTSIPDLLEDFDDHDRSLSLLGKVKSVDSNGNVSLSDYNRELYFYIDMLSEDDAYYEEGKTRFTFCQNHFEGKIGDNTFFPDDDQDTFDDASGWTAKDFQHLVLEFEFTAKNNYNNFQF